MSASGLHQWLPRGRGWFVASVVIWALWATWQFLAFDDLTSHLLGVVSLGLAVWWVGALSCRVQADDDGLHVRGAWWRTRTVPWTEVSDIRPRNRWRRSPLVVVTRSGRKVMTGLRAIDHEASLVGHWRERTGRESVPAV